MVRTKKVKSNDEEFNTLVDRVSDVAKLATKREDRKVGIRNMSIKTWIYDRSGHQTLLPHEGKMIVDYATFTDVIMKQGCWKEGCIVRDDSILSSSDIPGEKTERSINEISDETLKKALADEDFALSLLKKVTSQFSIERLRDAASKARPKRNTIIEECEARLFIMENELPKNFYSMGPAELAALVASKNLPIELVFGDDADSVRDKIISLLSVE